MRTETIATRRLILRRLRVADAGPLHQNCSSDPETARYLKRRAVADPQETAALVAEWVQGYETEDFFLWGIELDGEVIGTVNLHDVCRDMESCEIGYSIGSRWWNRGIMTEAATAVVKHAFDKLEMRRISGWCAAENIGSARVMEKIGMQKEGCARQALRLNDGRLSDQLWFAILRDDLHAPPLTRQEESS